MGYCYSNMMDANTGAGTCYPSGARDFAGIRGAQSFAFC